MCNRAEPDAILFSPAGGSFSTGAAFNQSFPRFSEDAVIFSRFLRGRNGQWEL
jgi:hypothetical protein